MSKMILHGHGTVIVPYSKGQCRPLEKMNSDFDKVYHKEKEISGFYVPYDEKTGCYLTYNRNLDTMPGLTGYTESDIPTLPYKDMVPFDLVDDIDLTDLQSSMVTDIFGGRDPRSKSGLLNKSWYINLGTGFGKTLLSLYIAGQIGYKTAVVCGSRKILDQWDKSLKQNFTFNPERMMHIDSGAFMELIAEGKRTCEDEDVFFISANLITIFGNKKGWKYVAEFFKNLGIGCLIIDEAHLSIGNTIRMTAVANIRYIQYLSADYGQGNYKREKLFFNAFANVPVIRPREEIQEDMKYTVGVVVLFNSLPTKNESEVAIYNRYGYDANRYMQYEMKKGVFQKALIWVIETINKTNINNNQVLILATNVWAVDEIKSFLEDHYIMHGKTVARYHSSILDEEKDFYKRADFIVATYASFSTGIDINTIKYVIGTNQSNKVEDNQAAGRAGRKFKVEDDREVFYFILTDEGFSYCKKKLPTRITYLKRMKLSKIVSCKFLDLDNVIEPNEE